MMDFYMFVSSVVCFFGFAEDEFCEMPGYFGKGFLNHQQGSYFVFVCLATTFHVAVVQGSV